MSPPYTVLDFTHPTPLLHFISISLPFIPYCSIPCKCSFSSFLYLLLCSCLFLLLFCPLPSPSLAYSSSSPFSLSPFIFLGAHILLVPPLKVFSFLALFLILFLPCCLLFCFWLIFLKFRPINMSTYHVFKN